MTTRIGQAVDANSHIGETESFRTCFMRKQSFLSFVSLGKDVGVLRKNKVRSADCKIRYLRRYELSKHAIKTTNNPAFEFLLPRIL